jgi:glutamyl-tRNA reductase
VPAVPVAHASSLPAASAAPDPAPTVDEAAMPLSLFGLEFSLDTSSIDALEAVARAVTPQRIGEWFARQPGTEEVARLSTCHRVEIVLLARRPDEPERWRDLLPGSPSSWRLREGRAVVHHLFRVAAGRESLARGEAEVRGQVRGAGRSVQSRHPRPVLRALFDGAANAAGSVAPSVDTSRSIASIAAARLLELVARPLPRVLVIGSGAVGRRVTERLASYARVTVVFHRTPPEAAFLAATGARAVGLDRLHEELGTTDALVTAAKFGDRGLRAADLPRDHPLVLVDLGMPRNIDPDVRDLPAVRLVDLEELHRPAGRLPGEDDQDALVEGLAGRFSDHLEGLLLEPWIDAFRRAAEDVRRAELAIARPYLGPLGAEQAAAVERLTQRLVARLLLPPTQRIRSLPPGPEGDFKRRFAVELLRPRSADP